MKLVIGFVFATALAATPAIAFEGCAGHAQVTASVTASSEAAAPAAPVQTAEAPATTQTK